MRNTLVLALAATMMVWAPTAEAKKDKSAEAAAPTFEIKDTGIAKIDATFTKAKAPIESVIKARGEIDALSKNLVTALGLTEGTAFADAVADLKTKAAGKVKVSIENHGLPKMTASEAVPANVQAAIDAVNAGFANITTAVAALTEIPAQLAAVAEEAKTYTDPNVLKDLASDNPAALLKAPKTIAKNIEALTQAPNEVKALGLAADTCKKNLIDAFAN